MAQINYSSAVGFALLLTVATAAETQLVQAQANAFRLPESVPQGTTVRIDGSTSMTAVNNVLKQRFEKQFGGTQVNLANNGTAAGLKAVSEGKVDLAAIGRPLTEPEKARGLNAVQVGRDKIAIVVGQNNPFARSLTIPQFAQIFRGEITNWSQVGGRSAPIQFVDRPNTSDTRQAFRNYPVFQKGKFETGKTAKQLNQDTIQAVAQALGNNGISYSTANQIRNQKGVKAVPMHGTPPTDARYPFSQPLYYVYKGAPSEAVQSFLGFATAPVGQQAIAQAGVADALIAPKTTTAKPKTEGAGTKKPATAGADKAATKKASGQAGDQAVSLNAPSTQGGTAQGGNEGGTAKGGGFLGFLPSFGSEATGADTGTGKLPNWLWWLLPIGSGAALLWLLGRGRRRTPAAGATGSFNPPDEGWSSNGYAPDYTPPNVEGGFAPVQDDVTFTGDLDRTGFTDPGTENGQGWFDNTVQAGTDFVGGATKAGGEAVGNAANLRGAALAGGAAMGAAAWAALGNRNGKSRVVLKSRSSQEVEAFWDIPSEERQAARQQGGEKLALRLFDVTDIDLERQPAHSVQQFECDELTQRQRLPIALPNRDYLAEIGYLTRDGQWLGLARSGHVRVSDANLFGNVAKAGGAAVAGGAAIAGGAVDSAKSFLAGDRDPSVTDAEDATWTEEPPTEPSSPNWFQRVSQTVSDKASDVTQAGGSAVAGGAAIASGAGAAAWSFLSGQNKASEPSEVRAPETSEGSIDASPFSAENQDFVTGETYAVPTTAGEGRLVLTPRNGQWAYAYWDIPRMQRANVDRQPGTNLVLRLYDVTNAEIMPDHYEQFDVDDLALSCDVPIPMSDRSYMAEIGYVDANNIWTRLAQSASVWVPAT